MSVPASVGERHINTPLSLSKRLQRSIYLLSSVELAFVSMSLRTGLFAGDSNIYPSAVPNALMSHTWLCVEIDHPLQPTINLCQSYRRLETMPAVGRLTRIGLHRSSIGSLHPEISTRSTGRLVPCQLFISLSLHVTLWGCDT